MTRDSQACPADELGGVLERVRLHAELALLAMLDQGYGYADPRLPAETYLHDDGARSRVFRLGLRPRGAHRESAENTADAIAALEPADTPLLDGLAARLRLDRAERGILSVALAHEIDRDVRSLCGALSGRRAPGLYADLCLELAEGELADQAALSRALSPAGELRHVLDYRDPGGPIRLTPLARQWLAGDHRLPEHLAPWVDARQDDELDSHRMPVADHLGAELDRLAGSLGPGSAPVVVQGPQGVGKRDFAEQLAARLGLPLFATSVPRLEQGGVVGSLPELLRSARIFGAGVYLAGVESVRDRKTRSQLLALLAAAGLELLVLGTRQAGLLRLGDLVYHHVVVPPADVAAREDAWRRELDDLGLAGPGGDDAALYARRFVVGPSDIRNACQDARRFSALRGRDATTVDIEAALARQLSLDLGSFATRVGRRALWDEMVLSDDVIEPLRDMVAMVQQRSQILEEWGYARHLGLSRGVSALFSGSPGTGKTMAASVISGELGLELFRIDLSQVVSKWVGETEKHLAQIFDEAQNANAMLLFDEADSIFGKRTEVKSASDRYANLEVNYILQRMEQFDGVSILTTNLETAIDPAFTRRLNFRIRFPDPDPDERLELWKTLVPPETGLRDLPDLERLASRFEMTGGHIRNAIVRAAVIAARAGRTMRADDLVAGALAEYAELGKVMGSF